MPCIKLLVTSDTHFQNKHSKFDVTNGINDLLTSQLAFADSLVDIADDYDLFIHGGDLTDHPTIDPATLSVVNKFVSGINRKVQSLWLEGNHCIDDKFGNSSILSSISKVYGPNDKKPVFVTAISSERYKVLDNKLVHHTHPDFHLHESDLPTLNIVCLPYFKDFKWLEDKLSEINETLTDPECFNLLLFHFPSLNGILDNGLASKNGVRVTPELTSNFDFCLGGDYHTRHTLVGHPKAMYIGSPFDLKFGEHQPRGALEIRVDLEKRELDIKLVENKHLIPLLTLTSEEARDITDSRLRNAVVKLVGGKDRQNLSLEAYKVFYTDEVKESEDKLSLAVIKDGTSKESHLYNLFAQTGERCARLVALDKKIIAG